MSLLLVFFITG